MTRRVCVAFRRDLGAFLDGELTGAERLALARHCAECPDCERELRSLRDVSNALRAAAHADPVPRGLDGLAAGVISRTRAESAASWRGVLSRAREDWHWILVGGGSVGATFACAAMLSSLLAFGPKPAREDSLAAFITDLTTTTSVIDDANGPNRQQVYFSTSRPGSQSSVLQPLGGASPDASDPGL